MNFRQLRQGSAVEDDEQEFCLERHVSDPEVSDADGICRSLLLTKKIPATVYRGGDRYRRPVRLRR